MTYEVHPAAALFPMMSGQAFEEFVADIRDHGQQDPAVLDTDGRLIDGRNRARACERLGIEVRTTVYEGTDVLQFVVSHNLHRRHLTDSQRAMIAARLATRGPGQRNQRGHMNSLPPTLDQAADLLDVTRPTLQKAKQVIEHGTQDLQDLAAEGGTPVATAARVAKELPPDEQDAYVAKVRSGADPVKAAPPDLAQQNRRKGLTPETPRTAIPQPPRFGGNRRKHVAQLDALVMALAGATAAFEGVDTFDHTLTSEEATRLTGDLSKQIKSLNRINSLIKERTA